MYKVDNGTVSEELYFGKIGETIKTIKTIKDGSASATYITKYTFDNLGRMRTMVYPDGEILTYSYNHGGLLMGAVGETLTGKNVYLEKITYDEFGQRTSVKYGNGTESTYQYEPVMRRLSNLKTTSSGNKTLQNIAYKYDDVGNITERNNTEFNTNDDVSRNSEQSYEYDNMDRLESSKGKFDYETWNPFWDKRVNTYTNEFSYNKTGKILQKTQENKGLLVDTDETVTIAATTYDWEYKYTGSHPNAVTEAGTRTMGYDLNGNMTVMTDSPLTPVGGTTGVTRTLTWDEENRLKKTVDSSGSNSIITSYKYDASGMRALKIGKYGTVQYVSDNYTVRNKDLFSKHVFAGNTRLVSKVIMQEEKSGKMVPTEQGSYYYHADHLGSSSVVTDKAGKFYEHIEYFPYGEMWVQNKATSEQTSTPYKFTSKELDDETGLYYFGARYYDARLSRWVSADPPISRGDYFPVTPINDKAKDRNSNLPGMGGVFNSINLDVYQYAGQNPVKLVDPDGNAFVHVNEKGKTEYFAATRIANMVKSGYGFIPFAGNEIFNIRCKVGNLYDLGDDSTIKNILGKSIDVGGLPTNKIGKYLGKVGLAFNLIDFASSIHVYKAEFVIDAMNIFDGKDLEFIAANSEKVAYQISGYIDSGEISVEGNFMNGKDLKIKDEMNYLNQMKKQIENEYKQYEYNRDYKD